jgi:hypothetical protein
MITALIGLLFLGSYATISFLFVYWIGKAEV